MSGWVVSIAFWCRLRGQRLRKPLEKPLRTLHRQSEPHGRAGAEGKEVNSDDPQDERVIYRERFQAQYFDFRGKSFFTRYDRCEFVKCTLLIDRATEQLAFTECVFKDCNIDKLQSDEERGLYVMHH